MTPQARLSRAGPCPPAKTLKIPSCDGVFGVTKRGSPRLAFAWYVLINRHTHTLEPRGFFEGIGVCIGVVVPAKRGQTQNTTVGTAKLVSALRKGVPCRRPCLSPARLTLAVCLPWVVILDAAAVGELAHASRNPRLPLSAPQNKPNPMFGMFQRHTFASWDSSDPKKKKKKMSSWSSVACDVIGPILPSGVRDRGGLADVVRHRLSRGAVRGDGERREPQLRGAAGEPPPRLFFPFFFLYFFSFIPFTFLYYEIL